MRKERLMMGVGLAVLLAAGSAWANDCLIQVNQQAGVNLTLRVDYPAPVSRVFVVTNAGTIPASYTVEKLSACDWLTLDKAGGGPLNSLATDQVTATINAVGLSVGVHSCQLKFTDDCDPAGESVRTVQLTIREPIEWVADFTNWVGQDVTAVSAYTDTNGQNPNQFGPPGSVPGTGWLTQGTRVGVPTTAKFLYPVPGGSGNQRSAFSSNLSTQMLAEAGLSFAWKARYGNYSIGRGPVFLQVIDSANNAHRVYFRVQNGTNMRIINNSGGNMAGIDNLVLPYNVSNPPLYHDWSAAVITATEEVSPGTFQNRAHWKVWLNGQQLLFTGANGTHVYQEETYSFFTVRDSTEAAGQYRLGELNQQTTWDFEFDCVAYRDDLNGGVPLVCEADAEYCELYVPPGNRAATAYRGLAATPAGFDYQVTNIGTVAAGYTVIESDADGNPLDYAWLGLSKAGEASIPARQADILTATILGTDLPGGTHTAYITFTETCNPAQKFTRRIDLTVTDCLSHVDQEAGVYRTRTGQQSIDPVVFTVTNAGVKPISYTVEKIDACDWLTLDKNGGGPLVNLWDTDTVTATIDPTGLALGLHTCRLKFTDTCAPAVEMIRTVHLSLRDATSSTQWMVAEFQTFEGQDRTATSPLQTLGPVDIPVQFVVGAGNEDPEARGAPPGWITQGTINGAPTTVKFAYAGTTWCRSSMNTRDAANNVHLPLNSQYDPAKGLAWTYSMKLGNYTQWGTDIRRGPVQLVLPTVAGQPGGGYAAGVPCYSIYLNILTDTITGSGDPIREIRILNNDGGRYAIDSYVLPQSLVDEYHVWSVSALHDPAFNTTYAYWNLWVDGKRLLFGGTDGSPVGPGGQVYSFRTAQRITNRGYVRLGEVGNTGTERFWDMEFDYVRVISLDVPGAPYWDGKGWRPPSADPNCGDMWADADRDGDIDQDDFAAFQRCVKAASIELDWPNNHPCWCFDRDRDRDIDSFDLEDFAACGTGPDVPYDLENLPPGCDY